MRRASDPDMRRLLRALVAAGCSVDDGGRHIKARTPAGRLIVLPVSPSDRRGYLNTRADARRMLAAEGLTLET